MFLILARVPIVVEVFEEVGEVSEKGQVEEECCPVSSLECYGGWCLLLVISGMVALSRWNAGFFD